MEARGLVSPRAGLTGDCETLKQVLGTEFRSSETVAVVCKHRARSIGLRVLPLFLSQGLSLNPESTIHHFV